MFLERYDPTIEDSYRKPVQIELGPDRIVRRTLEILDTAGTDQFAAMRELYLKTGDAFVIVYSVTSAGSFHDVKALYQQIMQARPEKDVLQPFYEKAKLHLLVTNYAGGKQIGLAG